MNSVHLGNVHQVLVRCPVGIDADKELLLSRLPRDPASELELSASGPLHNMDVVGQVIASSGIPAV